MRDDRAADALAAHLADRWVEVRIRIAAAEALCRIDRPEAALAERVAALAHESFCVRLEAANVLDRIGEKAQPLRGAMKKAIEDQSHENMFVRCLLDHTLATLDE